MLNGKKLKGEFVLVHTRGMGENSWLLIKHRDKYATTDDITEKDKSVQSGKTIEKIAASSKKTWSSNRKTKESSANKSVPKKAAAKRLTPEKSSKKKVNDELSETPETPFPKTISPMLATLVDKPFDEPGWLYEIKWDGYRALALM